MQKQSILNRPFYAYIYDHLCYYYWGGVYIKLILLFHTTADSLLLVFCEFVYVPTVILARYTMRQRVRNILYQTTETAAEENGKVLQFPSCFTCWDWLYFVSTLQSVITSESWKSNWKRVHSSRNQSYLVLVLNPPNTHENLLTGWVKRRFAIN